MTPEQVQRYGRWLAAQQKDENAKITVTGDDFHVSTQAIYFTHWHVNGIGGGQHGIISIVLWGLPFRPIELFTCSAWDTWCTCVYPVIYTVTTYCSLCPCSHSHDFTRPNCKCYSWECSDSNGEHHWIQLATDQHHMDGRWTSANEQHRQHCHHPR